jgi:hypothetical protein
MTPSYIQKPTSDIVALFCPVLSAPQTEFPLLIHRKTDKISHYCVRKSLAGTWYSQPDQVRI